MNANESKNEKPKAVLITGAARRVGFELAKECLELGYHVVIHYRTSAEPALSAFAEDERVFFMNADLTAAPEKFMESVFTLPVEPVGLINNASTFQPGDMTDAKHFCGLLNVNAITPLRLSTEFAKRVTSGWIINITDARTRPMNKKFQNYRVSKLFLDEITRQLAYLYAPNFRVNAIAPGATLPDAYDMRDGGTQTGGETTTETERHKKFEELAKTIPLGRTGAPNNIRHTVRFLIENDYITGAIIPVDGGWGL